jgi:two-component system, chemotaxis family, sensor kinase CheA
MNAEKPNEPLLPDDELSRSVFIEFIDESLDALNGLDAQLIQFETNPDDLAAINAIFRPVHSVKGNSAFFGMMKTKKIAHELENILDLLRKEKKRITPQLMSVLLKGFDMLRGIFERVREGGAELADETDSNRLLEEITLAVAEEQPPPSVWPELIDKLDRMFIKLRKQDQKLVEEVEELLSKLRQQMPDVARSATKPAASKRESATHPPPEAIQDAPLHDKTAREENTAPAERQGKTLRISEEQLDVFLSYVGELVVVGKMFNHLHTDSDLAGNKYSNFSSRFRQVNETFEDLSSNLQRSIMSLRRMPLKNAFSKIPRLVHDVAAQKRKDIRVVLEDNDVLVDKSILDMLDAPITHMVRNAADHGIETPQVREAAGKPRQGTVRISAHEQADTILLEITDDGAGLNLDALQRKGVEMGLLPDNRAASMEEITKVLFAPGVSTSKEITDISGRGVGMDVVLRAIESNGGSITTTTNPGMGTTFGILLSKSVSTQILNGFLVRTGSNVLVIPMDRVVETAQINRDSISSVKGTGHCIQRHGTILPLFSLGQILNLPLAPVNAKQQTIVVTNIKGTKKALIVDELVGVQQVVVKPIEGLESMLDCFSGGALMGDGSVALVLDLDSLDLR